MKKVFFIISVALLCSTTQMKAQFAVIDPANIAQSIANTASEVVHTSATVENVIKDWQQVQSLYNTTKGYYDQLKQVNDLLKDAKKVKDCILLVGDIGDIYVNSFGKMLADPHFDFDELQAISDGYTILLNESADMINELKGVVTENGLSMTDHERMDIISDVYDRLKNHRNLVSYYTRKNISISYIRSQKAGDEDAVMALYGNANDKYW